MPGQRALGGILMLSKNCPPYLGRESINLVIEEQEAASPLLRRTCGESLGSVLQFLGNHPHERFAERHIEVEFAHKKGPQKRVKQESYQRKTS